MQTQYFKVDKDNPDSAVLAAVAVILKQGGLVAFPTETVYGLGANGLDEQAVAGIYRAKGRPSDNPIILHIADQEMVEQLVDDIPPKARLLMAAFWPGPLTIVLKRNTKVPDSVAGGLDTVAVRLPDSRVARDMIRMAGVPIAAPSANVSGRPSPTTAQAVLADLEGRIEAVIDVGSCAIGVESTVVDCTTSVPTLLRPGGITLEMLSEAIGIVEVDPSLENEPDSKPRSPGMKYTHYAPNAPMTLVEGTPEQVEIMLCQRIAQALADGKRVGAVVSDETAEKLPADVVVAAYGARDNVAEVASNLYIALRYFDTTPVDIIFAEGIAETGLGSAVMNRLRKASSSSIVKAD